MKGYLYTLESMIASLLILSTILIVYTGVAQTNEFETVSILDNAYNCLKHLDNEGILRHYALNNDSAQMRGYVNSCMPKTSNFSIGFCETCVSADVNKTVVLMKYIIAGDGSAFQPTVVNMLVWSLI